MFVGGVNIISTNEFVNIPNDFGLGEMGKWVLDSISGLVDVCKDAQIQMWGLVNVPRGDIVVQIHLLRVTLLSIAVVMVDATDN